MPLRLLIPYLHKLPGLMAEEALATVERLAIGTGAAREADRDRRIAEWRRAAGSGPVSRASTPEGLRAMAAGAGIAFRTVKVNG